MAAAPAGAGTTDSFASAVVVSAIRNANVPRFVTRRFSEERYYYQYGRNPHALEQCFGGRGERASLVISVAFSRRAPLLDSGGGDAVSDLG
jgi:hypothetical protein